MATAPAEMPSWTMPALRQHLIRCSKEGVPVYDYGDVSGDRHVTIRSGRDAVRFEGMTPLEIRSGARFGDWIVRLTWDRAVLLPSLDDQTSDMDRYIHGLDMGAGGTEGGS